LPVFRWGACGDPRDQESAPDPTDRDYPPLGKERLIGAAGFAVQVRGESMANRHIHDGDTVWINPDRPVRLGRPVLARVWAADGTEVGMVVKVLKRDDGGERLWGDGEGEEGSNPVICSRYDLIGPVVWVEPAGFPPN
jgi:SOS-response transcriptional repressor LexA